MIYLFGIHPSLFEPIPSIVSLHYQIGVGPEGKQPLCVIMALSLEATLAQEDSSCLSNCQRALPFIRAQRPASPPAPHVTRWYGAIMKLLKVRVSQHVGETVVTVSHFHSAQRR